MSVPSEQLALVLRFVSLSDVQQEEIRYNLRSIFNRELRVSEAISNINIIQTGTVWPDHRYAHHLPKRVLSRRDAHHMAHRHIHAIRSVRKLAAQSAALRRRLPTRSRCNASDPAAISRQGAL